MAILFFGTPHAPFKASDEDRAPFSALNQASQNHYGELVAMDRSIGTLRKGLRDLEIADNTLLWFCSDNGGLSKIEPDTVGGLRGHKNTLYEGGLRVPCVIEWPAVISKPRVTRFPSVTMDVFPTIAEIVGLPDTSVQQPVDGISLRPLMEEEKVIRSKPIPFRHTKRAAIVDNHYKLVIPRLGEEACELYHLENDPGETDNLFVKEKEVAGRLLRYFKIWNASVEKSLAGMDYPEGRLLPGTPESRRWTKSPEYAPYVDRWLQPSGRNRRGGKTKKQIK